ncbi:MAG: Type CRISPR-associated protein Cas7/Cse4/CasC [Verrucomicrobiales bacterium]|nr:Type CRISPR-associated protein Cas7/Cse4/CasC [Verrucomicrobiales bacterium]
MKLIELHILQSFPVSCLNRDDVGSPKTALFGGVNRARLSSQCLKRAARVHAREHGEPERFQGIRSRFLLEAFSTALTGHGLTPDQVAEKAKSIAETLSKLEVKKKETDSDVTTAVFLSPSEIEQIAAAVAGGDDPKKAAKKATRLDAADIALFGRMIANDPTLNVEGAALFSHALSTHQTANEVDFFSAVDDRKTDAADAGAGMIGTLEFSSATYYRYCAVNLSLLEKESHLGLLAKEERRQVVEAFLRAILLAVPGARQNSMNAATLPHTALGVVKEKGQPLQLINAFEKPVSAKQGGLADASAERMKAHYGELNETWGLTPTAEVWLPETNVDGFLKTLLSHV